MNNKRTIIISGLVILFAAILLFIFLGNKTYKVRFDSAGGTSIETQSVKKDKTATKPTDPTREGYTFDNWYLDDKEFDFNTKITKDIKLVAKWITAVNGEETTFTVSFDSNGGSSVSAIKVTKDGLLTKPTAPTKEGYDFVSWQVNGKDFDFTTKVTGNIKLTAKWVASTTKGTTTSKKTTSTTTKKITTEPVADKINVTSVELSKTSLSLKVGETATLTATIKPANATNKTASWNSSNKAVATVDSNGKITAIGAGTATITVSVDGKTATCVVKVEKVITYSVEWVEVSGSSIGQYTLYIKSSEGKHVAGTVEITSVSGNVSTKNIPASGTVFIKSAISSAKVKNID